jgi:hypothetical protein
MNTNEIKIGSIDDPIEAAKIRARIEAGERNAAWLSEHWSDFLPQARGKFVVVAAQEGHIADSAEEAWAWAQSVHPEDDGALVQYVRTGLGPRIYAYRRELAFMRRWDRSADAGHRRHQRDRHYRGR